MQLDLKVPGGKTKRASDWQVDVLPSLRHHESEDTRELLELLGKVGFSIFLHNRQSMPGELRRITLNRLRNSAVNALGKDSQIGRLRDASPEASLRNRDILALAQRISHELALGYKSMVADTLNPESALGTQAHRAEIFGEAMRWLLNEMLFAYESYLPPPEHAWPEICQLYRAAATRLQIADYKLDGGSGTTETRQTLHKRFQQAALLIIADPFRLPAKEIWHIKRYLDWWADEAQLSLTKNTAPGPGRFIIDLTGKHPPPLINGVPADLNKSASVVLDTSKLLDKLRSHIGAVQLPNSKPQPWIAPTDPMASSQMLRRMLFAWHRTPARHHPRQEKAERCEVLIGLDSVHKMLLSVYPDAAVTADFTAALSRGRAKDPAPKNTSANKMPPVRLAEQMDASEGGTMMRILPNDRDLSLPMVNTVVALRQDEQPTGWAVGIVRWLTHAPNGTLTCGVQYLRGELRPLTAWRAKDDLAQSQVFSGVCVSSPNGDPSLKTMFTNVGLFEQDAEIMIIGGGQYAFKAKIDKLLESSDEYERYYCEVYSDADDSDEEEDITEQLDLEPADIAAQMAILEALDEELILNAEATNAQQQAASKPADEETMTPAQIAAMMQATKQAK